MTPPVELWSVRCVGCGCRFVVIADAFDGPKTRNCRCDRCEKAATS